MAPNICFRHVELLKLAIMVMDLIKASNPTDDNSENDTCGDVPYVL